MRHLRLFTIVIGLLFCQQLNARAIYLNGTDISSARSQDLKNVHIHINERGDVFIIAPHYRVNDEDSFTPLSVYVNSMQPSIANNTAPANLGVPEVLSKGRKLNAISSKDLPEQPASDMKKGSKTIED